MPAEPQNPPDLNRRRLLVALGYGAVGLGAAKVIADAPLPVTVVSEPKPDAAVATEGASAATGSSADGAVAVQGTQLATPPILDASVHRKDANFLFDVAINGGVVMDPASGYEAVANVGIEGGRITHIGATPLRGTAVVDATDQVVAPGFIDILSYEPNPFGVWFKVADGVTTNLAMHGINNYANPFFRRYTDKVPLHFGGAFHQHFLRGDKIGLRPDQQASAGDLDQFAALAEKYLSEGFAGISYSPEYSPGTSTDEILRLAEVAAGRGHVLFFHARFSDPVAPGTNAEAVAEVLDVSRKTGLPVHIEHITSTGGTFTMAQTLDTLNQARAEGVDVTACLYPYDYWATTLDSFRFAGNWQERFGLSVEDLQIGGTETFLTPETFDAARQANQLVAAHGSIPEAEVELALQQPWTMIGSDAIPTPSLNNHPRASGTFARTLGRYVRDRQTLTLMDALAKMTILPAQRVERMMPAMTRKGRAQIGADADITVFNPATVTDRATVAHPGTASAGISTVLVNGVAVLADGLVDQSKLPGQPIKSA